MFRKTRKEDDTSERASISLVYLPVSYTGKSRRERGRDLLPTYSDGVTSPYQSHMAANPLLWKKRWKEGWGHEDAATGFCIQEGDFSNEERILNGWSSYQLGG